MKRTFWDRLIADWYHIAVYLAGACALALCVGEWDAREKMLLGSAVFIFLHFFEKFGYPGGFPWIGMRVEPNSYPEKHLSVTIELFSHYCKKGKVFYGE